MTALHTHGSPLLTVFIQIKFLEKDYNIEYGIRENTEYRYGNFESSLLFLIMPPNRSYPLKRYFRCSNYASKRVMTDKKVSYLQFVDAFSEKC